MEPLIVDADLTASFTDVIGSTTAERGILIIYEVFGFF